MEYVFEKAENILPFLSPHVLRMMRSFDREHTSLRAFRKLQEKSSRGKYARIVRAFLIFVLNSLPYQLPGNSAAGPEFRSLRKLYKVDRQAELTVDILRDAVKNASVTDEEAAGQHRNASGGASHRGLDVGEDHDDDDGIDDEVELDAEESGSEDEDPNEFAHQKEPEKCADRQAEATGFNVDCVRTGALAVESLLLLLAESPLNREQIGPLYAFFACYSVDFEHMCMKRTDRVSQGYSGFIYFMELAVLDYLWSPWAQVVQSEQDPRGYVAGNPFERRIGPWLNAYFKHQSAFPLGDLLATRAYAFYCNRVSSAVGNEVFEIGPHHLRHHGLEITQEELRQFFQRSVRDLGQKLVSGLLLGDGLELFDVVTPSKATATEDFVKSARGFNFLAENEELGGYSEYILERILDDPSAVEKWFGERDDEPVVQPHTAELYLKSTEKFLMHLLVLVHMSSGAPARGTEIIPILYADTVVSQRNLFLDPRTKLFLIRLHYSKTMAATGMERNAVLLR